MKYLKKIFEDFDSKSQYEIIEDFFLDLLENQTEEISCEMDDIDESQTYCIFRVYLYSTSKLDNLEEFDEVIEQKKMELSFLQKLKVTLKRLTSSGYNWEWEEDSEQGLLTVSVFYKKDVEENLELAIEPLLNGQKAFHESILKKVLNKKYGLNLTRISFAKATSGYYGKNPEFSLWFEKQTFDYEHQLYKDLEKIKSENRSDYNLLYSFEIINISGGTMLKIKLRY